MRSLVLLGLVMPALLAAAGAMDVRSAKAQQPGAWHQQDVIELHGELHGANCNSVFSPDGQELVFGNEEGVYGVRGGSVILLAKGGQWLSLTPEGNLLIAGRRGIREMSFLAATFMHPWSNLDYDGASNIPFSPDGKLAVINGGITASAVVLGGSKFNRVKARITFDQCHAFSPYRGAYARRFVFTPDGRTLIGVNTEGQIDFWGIRESSEPLQKSGVRNFPSHYYGIQLPVFTRDGHLILSDETREGQPKMMGNVTVWDPSGTQRTIPSDPQGLFAYAKSANVLITAKGAWDCRDWHLLQEFQFDDHQLQSLLAVCISEDASKLAFIKRESVEFWQRQQ